MKILKATVINCLEAKTKWGPKIVLNCKLVETNEKIALWSAQLDNKSYLSKRQGEIIEVIENAGKYSLLDREPPHNIDGAGLKSVKEIMPNIPKSNSAVEDYLNNDLGLPTLLTDRQKQDLSKLTQERGKLLVYCIEVMRSELDKKGIEFHEGSVRSLGVSLFINISRYLP